VSNAVPPHRPPRVTRAVGQVMTTTDILNRIQRGLAGYVSYLAACDMNPAFSEYILYEPILRILTAQGFAVSCEYACPGQPNRRTGDKKRIDFRADKNGLTIAIEVKWAKRRRIETTADGNKLRAIRQHTPSAICYLCVFGRKSIIENIDVPKRDFYETVKAVYAEFGKTRYGCRMFTLR